MTAFTISDDELDHIKDQVVIITGASSGIGLATLRRVLKHGGKVFAADLNPLPEPEAATVPFQKVDVTSWPSQLAMFKAAEKEYGKIDHVFANAGVTAVSNFAEDDVDENGNPLPPKLGVINVNLIGCIYTVQLSVFFLKKNPKGGSVVATASLASVSRFSATDYATAKHGVLGLVRALFARLSQTSIRINALAPAWTETAIIPKQVFTTLGEGNCQSPDVVARSAIVLMADQSHNGALIYSNLGQFIELENGDTGFHALTKKMLQPTGEEELPEETVLRKLREQKFKASAALFNMENPKEAEAGGEEAAK